MTTGTEYHWFSSVGGVGFAAPSCEYYKVVESETDRVRPWNPRRKV